MPLGRWRLVLAPDKLSDGYALRFPVRENRPVWNALRNALLEQGKALYSMSPEPCKTAAEFEARAEEMRKAIQNVLELFRWLDPSDGVLTKQKVTVFTDGLSHESYADLIQHCDTRATPGRPIEHRDLAIRALELKSADRPPTWAEIAQKLCPCGKTQHDDTCAKNIRRNVNRLKLVLKKYSIPIAG